MYGIGIKLVKIEVAYYSRVCLFTTKVSTKNSTYAYPKFSSLNYMQRMNSIIWNLP